MKIQELQISNILSFKYYEDIKDAPLIAFDAGINILIGQNGAGKSTVLEIVNFIFKRILFLPYTFDRLTHRKKNTAGYQQLKQIIHLPDGLVSNSIQGFRLEPNWHTIKKEEKIRVKILLDEIDQANMEILSRFSDELRGPLQEYSIISTNMDFDDAEEILYLDISINPASKSYEVNNISNKQSLDYLENYNLYRYLIDAYNIDNADSALPTMNASFSLISGFRNYNSFTPAVSLSSDASYQMIGITQSEITKSANSFETAEPSIFNLVRLQAAGRHLELIFTSMCEDDVEKQVNTESLISDINSKLAFINLEVKIKLLDRNTWTYSFNFFDKRRNVSLDSIDALSSGQKAIIHLIFEAYGRGNLKGGVVIIDEPEIHLHYQLQHEYLKIIENLNEALNCQYILVTHSEVLINSKTIDKVRRLALDTDNNSVVFSPSLNADQKTLIKILDNTRSTYAFFTRKIVLVEGDTDRYFFTALFRILYPESSQEICVIDIGGKDNFKKWKFFFEAFGLIVYFICDSDNIFSLKYPEDSSLVSKEIKVAHENRLKQHKLNNLNEDQKRDLKRHYSVLTADADFLDKPRREPWKSLLDYFVNISKIRQIEIVMSVKGELSDIDQKIDGLLADNIFILKLGDLEDYLGTSNKDLNTVVRLCEDINAWMVKDTVYVKEIKEILKRITA